MAFPFDLYQGLLSPGTISPLDRRDLLDYAGSNTIQSGRYINPLTRDFEVGPNNHYLGMNAANQEILLALSTTFGSSIVPSFGNNVGSIKMINTANIVNQIQNVITQALSTLINNGKITLGNISVVNQGNGSISVSFPYTNNTLGVTANIQFTLVI